MGKHILLINPLGTDMFDGITVDLVRPHLAADTDVVCRSLGEGVPKTPFLAPVDSLRKQLVGAVHAAAAEGFDAVAISCCGDPALQDCKAASGIPVTAPLEAMAATATSLGPVCVIQRKLPEVYAEAMPTQRNNDWMKALVRSYGVADADVSFRRVPVAEHPAPEVVKAMVDSDPDGLRALILDAMAQSADGPGVELTREIAADGRTTNVFFACTFWSGLLEGVKASTALKVVDPLVVVAKYAEHLAVVA